MWQTPCGVSHPADRRLCRGGYAYFSAPDLLLKHRYSPTISTPHFNNLYNSIFASLRHVVYLAPAFDSFDGLAALTECSFPQLRVFHCFISSIYGTDDQILTTFIGRHTFLIELTIVQPHTPVGLPDTPIHMPNLICFSGHSSYAALFASDAPNLRELSLHWSILEQDLETPFQTLSRSPVKKGSVGLTCMVSDNRYSIIIDLVSSIARHVPDMFSSLNLNANIYDSHGAHVCFSSLSSDHDC